MSTLKKLHLYIAAIILTFSASYACDCEKKNSVFDFNTLVNIFLGHNEYGEVLGFLSLDVSEDLSGIVKKENFVFPETGHPEKLFGNAEYRKISSRAKNTHILDRQWNELSFKNKKLFLSELSSFDIAKFKGLGKSDTLESKGDVKILSAKLVDSSSKMPLREYTVTGGFKRNENGAYLDKSSLKDSYFYEINVYAEIFTSGGSRKEHMRVFRKYNPDGTFADIEALFSSSDGTSQLAEYEYSPFGEIRVQRGALASTNPLRFSSRYSESETDLYYYSYREYSPRLKKWVCKEPLGEKEDFNLYRFCYNTSFNGIDILGEKYSNLWVGIQPGPHNRPDIPQKNIPKEPNPYDKRSCLSIAVEIGLYFFFYEKAYRAWINYARGMGEDISLSDEEMKSLYNAANYNPETEKDIKDFEEKCAQGKITQKTISGGAYFDKFKDTDWFLTIGGHKATVRMSCKKCVAKIESYSVHDLYRFPIDNPEWDVIRKIGDGIARNQERCKWCPFKHIGTYKIP